MKKKGKQTRRSQQQEKKRNEKTKRVWKSIMEKDDESAPHTHL